MISDKDYRKFKVGDVIKINSSFSYISPVPIWHYGVVVGEDEVVHFNLVIEDINIRIIKTDFAGFVKDGSNLQVCQMSALHTKYAPREIAKRARSKVGSDFGGYNLLSNNCEHFANWCATGNKYSNQVVLKNEGDGHSVPEKVFEKVVAEPTLNILDDVSEAIDKLDEKTDTFLEGLGKVLNKIGFPWW